MNNTLEDTLKVIVEPYMPHQLVSPKNLSCISAIARMLPGDITNFFGFECRLGTSSSRADFLLTTAKSESGRGILSGDHATIKLPEILYTNPVWNCIQNFCRHWADPISPLYEKVDNIWLEFDVDSQLPQIPVPSFFWGSKTIKASHSNTILPKLTTHPQQWLTETALPLLLNQLLSVQVEQKLFECLDSLPTQAYIFQMGVMLARKSDAVRICVRDITPPQIPEYLTRIGWRGSVSDIKALILKLSNLVERIDLDLDVSSTILPKLGLECYVQIKPDSKGLQFLDYLVDAGLCLPEKRDALVAYPGHIHERLNRELWPQHLRHFSDFLEGRVLSTFFRTIHHIKVIYQPDRALEAKAYLGVKHYWLPVASLQQQNRTLKTATT